MHGSDEKKTPIFSFRNNRLTTITTLRKKNRFTSERTLLLVNCFVMKCRDIFKSVVHINISTPVFAESINILSTKNEGIGKKYDLMRYFEQICNNFSLFSLVYWGLCFTLLVFLLLSQLFRFVIIRSAVPRSSRLNIFFGIQLSCEKERNHVELFFVLCSLAVFCWSADVFFLFCFVCCFFFSWLFCDVHAFRMPHVLFMYESHCICTANGRKACTNNQPTVGSFCCLSCIFNALSCTPFVRGRFLLLFLFCFSFVFLLLVFKNEIYQHFARFCHLKCMAGLVLR